MALRGVFDCLRSLLGGPREIDRGGGGGGPEVDPAHLACHGQRAVLISNNTQHLEIQDLTRLGPQARRISRVVVAFFVSMILMGLRAKALDSLLCPDLL